MKLTDKIAIRTALMLAIDTEESLIDAYRNSYTGKVDDAEEGVIIARKRIEAFKRVLKRYYGIDEIVDPLIGTKTVSVLDLLKNKIEDKE